MARCVHVCRDSPQRQRGSRGEGAEEIRRGLRNISYAPAECPGKPATAPSPPPTSSISLPHHHFPSGLPKNRGWEPSDLSGQRSLPVKFSCSPSHIRKSHTDCRALRVFSCPLFEKLNRFSGSHQESNQTLSNFLAFKVTSPRLLHTRPLISTTKGKQKTSAPQPRAVPVPETV